MTWQFWAGIVWGWLGSWAGIWLAAHYGNPRGRHSQLHLDEDSGVLGAGHDPDDPALG